MEKKIPYWNSAFKAELLFFTMAQFLAIGAFFSFMGKPASSGGSGYEMSAPFFLGIFSLLTVLLLFVLKKKKGTGIIHFFLYIALLQGLVVLLGEYITGIQLLLVVAFLLVIYLVHHSIIVHNLVFVMALAGIGVVLGSALSLSVGLSIVLVLAVYDFVAVYGTKHMVTLFSGMASRKVFFALIFPFSFKEYFHKVSLIDDTHQYMFLGTGDVVVPLLVILPALRMDPLMGLWGSFGALVGLMGLYSLAYFDTQRRAHAGLPWIVGGACFCIGIYWITHL